MIMKKLKQIIGDGLAITIPVLVILYVFHKAHQVLQVGISPIVEKLGIDNVFGKVTLAILAALALVAIIMVMGLLMRFAIMRSVRIALENLVLRFFPFLNEFKAMMADRLEREGDEAWKSVALRHDDEIHFAFLVEETGEYGTFLVLKGRHAADGEMTIFEKGSYTYQVVDTTEMEKSIKRFGAGASALLKH